MRSLTVTAHLATPPAISWPIMLDALLLGGLGARLGAAHPSGWVDVDLSTPLPLARVEVGEEWWYACSQITPRALQAKSYTNRVPMVEEAARLTSAGSLNVAAGPDKRLRTPYYYRPGMLTLTWTCIGDAEEIGALLSHVTSIGKNRTHGCGWVQRWEIVEGGPDLAAYHSPTVRHVPSTLPLDVGGTSITRRFVPLRPPYWMRRDGVDCWQEVAT